MPIALESALERDCPALLALDPNLADLREQPVRIDDHGDSSHARHHTPNFLVLHDDESQG